MPYEQWLKDIEYDLEINKYDQRRASEWLNNLNLERIKLLDAKEELIEIIEKESD